MSAPLDGFTVMSASNVDDIVTSMAWMMPLIICSMYSCSSDVIKVYAIMMPLVANPAVIRNGFLPNTSECLPIKYAVIDCASAINPTANPNVSTLPPNCWMKTM